MGEIEREVAPLTLAYLPGLEGVDLRLSAWNLAGDDADRRLRSAADLLRERAGESVYGEGDTDLAALVLDEARSCQVRIAVAESCTGGLLGARLTEVPGSSEVFVGGVIAYADAVKSELLDVAPGADCGAWSSQRAGRPGDGAGSAPAASASQAALSITGIAGPGGGSPAKPVGTVWIGCVLAEVAETRRILFAGSRPEIRARAAQAALSCFTAGYPAWGDCRERPIALRQMRTGLSEVSYYLPRDSESECRK